MRALDAEPFSTRWYSVMEAIDLERLPRALELAEHAFAPDVIAAAPPSDLGFGPEYVAHRALTWVVNGLRRFPGRAGRCWPPRSGARSATTGARAADTLDAWDRAALADGGCATWLPPPRSWRSTYPFAADSSASVAVRRRRAGSGGYICIGLISWK